MVAKRAMDLAKHMWRVEAMSAKFLALRTLHQKKQVHDAWRATRIARNRATIAAQPICKVA